MPSKILISERGEFLDSKGNEIQLRGVNLDPSVKFPSSPGCTSHDPLSPSFFDDSPHVSYRDHPLALEDVETHIKRLKSLGYNTIRYPFTWESLEHEGPGIFDYEYMDYTIEVLKKINKLGGIYVYLDPHQDVWSRFTGGSGAPLWTLYCAGFQPRRFQSTEAAILQNTYIDPSSGKEKEPYPKMLWPTNYYRLAAQTMFTLFFGGKKFAPYCIVNGQNIQDYLQDKFTAAVMTLYSRIKQKAPELFTESCVIGLESMNEPNVGYFTDFDLKQIPKDRKLRRGTVPTSFQSFQLGMGLPVTVDTYDISIFGPRKTGTTKIDPKGQSAWSTKAERDEVDALYKWERSDEWEPGKCIWMLHGVWDHTEVGGPSLKKPEYFARDPVSNELIDLKHFINNQYLDHYRNFYKEFRKTDQKSFIFLQPPTLQEPPNVKDTDIIDDRTVYACHFYDGMSLMFKSWNRFYNVDTLGIMRGRYINPVFSVVLGEGNIRKCLRRQLGEMKKEGKQLLGAKVPVFFTEIGMPFDMDDKKAYETGDYSSQISAMDALGLALEGHNLSYSLWCYCSRNSHEWGDSWNNEDFSIWSKDNMTTTTESPKTPESVGSLLESTSSTIPHNRIEYDDLDFEEYDIDHQGMRALPAILRPYPLKICGTFESAEFDLSKIDYKLNINAVAKEGHPSSTLIYLPKVHFPMGQTAIKTTSGSFVYDPAQQILQWSHDVGMQSIALRKVTEATPPRTTDSSEECTVM